MRGSKPTMLQSMTGFSRKEVDISPYGRVFLEARSLNHRFLEIDVKVPKFLSHLVHSISEMVRKRFSRGKFTVALRFVEIGRLPARLVFNEELFREYMRILGDICREYGISSGLSAGDVVRLEGVFSLEGEQVSEDLDRLILDEIGDLLLGLMEDRLREGEKLVEDIERRISILEAIKRDIEALSGLQVKAFKESLSAKVKEFMRDYRLDPERLDQEVAFLSARMDITEELVRIDSHISAFKEALAGSSPAGRRLDFVAQELLREINTVGNKSYLPEISRKVVDFKDELEKIRQQVQNLE